MIRGTWGLGVAVVQDRSLLSGRETLLDTEVERKYIAFSIGLGIDRITLHRRLSLSRRNRDLAERNLAGEIQQMHGDIEASNFRCQSSALTLSDC